VGIQFKIAYGSDLAFVEELVKAAMARLENVRDGDRLTIMVTDVPDTTLQLTVSFGVKPHVGLTDARNAFFRALYAELQQRGIDSPATKPVLRPSTARERPVNS
jgi:small-conductance mechanosensitive channel